MNCPCGESSASLLPVFDKGEVDFLYCGSCGLVLRERFPTAAELDAIYREAYAEERIGSGNTNQESGGYAAKVYAEFIQRTLWKPGMRVLDYGTGTGALVEQLRASGVEADGLEFSANARCFCREKRGFSLMKNLDGVPDGCYQIISMIEVIEHLTDLRGTLQELRRVIAPGGYLLITTPNRKGLRAKLEGGLWREARKKFHLFLFDWSSLKFHLEATGFHGVRRIVYSPVQRPGIKSLMTMRLMQTLMASGTLCVMAVRGV